MIEGRPSETALHAAAARAAHLRFDPPPHLLEDMHAEALLGAEHAPLIGGYGDDGPWILVENRRQLPLRGRFVEERLAAAHDRGVRQAVILGAGLDTFALRQPAAWSDLAIYELDHPDTQGWKRHRFEQLGWSLPASLRLVPCDFESASIAETLAAAGFDRRRPAVVSWMGVVYYLSAGTVAAKLRELAELLAPDSELVLDAMKPWEDLPARYEALREAMTRYLDDAGEPQISRHRAADLERLLAQAGFGEVQVQEASRYLADTIASATFDRPVSERFLFAVARRRGEAGQAGSD